MKKIKHMPFEFEEKKISQHIICAICQEVPAPDRRVVIETNCSTLFCESCITTWSVQHRKPCPICHRPCANQLQPIPLCLRNIIGDLQVKCTDCGTVQSYNGIVQHMRVCEMKTITCIGCDWTGRLGEYSDHIEDCSSFFLRLEEMREKNEQKDREIMALREKIERLSGEVTSLRAANERLPSETPRMLPQYRHFPPAHANTFVHLYDVHASERDPTIDSIVSQILDFHPPAPERETTRDAIGSELLRSPSSWGSYFSTEQ
jgi:hypothetical protein